MQLYLMTASILVNQYFKMIPFLYSFLIISDRQTNHD